MPAAVTTPAAAGAAGVRAQAPGPHLSLIAVQRTVTIVESGHQPVLVDPDVWVASNGSAFRLNVRRASYTRPVTVTQIISTPRGTVRRALPGSVLDGWNGLRGFIQFTLSDAHGKVIDSQPVTFCPGDPNAERATPASPATDPYPQQCGAYDPFPLGQIWGLPKGWAVDPFGSVNGVPGQVTGVLAAGKYRATMSIAPQYRRLFGVGASAATVSVGINVVNVKNCPPPGCGTSNPSGAAFPPPPSVRAMAQPPQGALPQLTALPSWGISTSSRSGHDLLTFGATVWVGGNAPLDVEGFHVAGSSLMVAYQYFWRDGKVIGRAPVGTMGYDSQPGHHHWHFEQFAQYRLLTANHRLAVRSEKAGFCLAPTDPVDLLLPHATWQPASTGLVGQCGRPDALWVQEYLPVGWGDTYDQTKAGQAFDITNLPDGVYYIEIIANPRGVLHELSTAGNVSMRKVILGGTKDHRTVRVPAWNGIDLEG